MDLRQTPEYARYMQTIGWSVVGYRVSGIGFQVFIKKLLLLGNIGKLQRPEGKLDLQKLDEFAKKHRLAALYIEASLNTRYKILDTKYKIHNSSFLPSKTIRIDLTLSEEKILNGMKKKTRYEIRLAQENKVWVAQSKDADLFSGVWQKSARKRGMWLPQKKEITALCQAFGQKAHILFAYKNRLIPDTRYPIPDLPAGRQDTPLAGVLLAHSPDTAYYMYAFSTKEGNKLSAPTLLVWEAIKLAKNEKCKVFDFEGIYDERYPQTKNWKGFTKFKEGFEGKVVIYPQTLVRYYSPLAKLLNL